MSAAQIKSLVKSGRWRRTHHDIFVIDGTSESFRQEAAVAASVGGVCSHRLAGALYGFEGIKPREIEITVTTKYPPVRFAGAVVIHRTNHLPDDHLREHNGLPLTDVARTVLDLGGLVPYPVMRRAAISAVDKKLVTPDQLSERLRCCGRQGRPGTKNFRQLMMQMDWELDISDSDLEDAALELIRGAGLPEPVRLFRAYGGGVLLGEIDLAYPSLRLGIEVDSFAFHGARPDFIRDRARLNGLIADGWRILHFVYEDSLRPRRFLTSLKRALDRE